MATQPITLPLIERVQIRELARIVFGMTILAAIPGFFADLYPILFYWDGS